MRALTTVDPNALGCLVSPTLVLSLSNYTTSLDRELVLQNLFGLPHNVLTCNLADAYLRAHEDEEMETVKKRHLGPVTSKSLEALGREGGVKLGWTEYRVGILRYLGERGVTGIGDLMRTTVKGVMDSTVA
jgi:centromere protein I